MRRTKPYAAPDYGRLLSPQEAAGRLDVHVKDIYRWASSRQITAVRANGRLKGIYEADVRDWLRRNRIVANEESQAPRPRQHVDAWMRDLIGDKPFYPL
jgi:excisionase family DNA binding protein